VQRPGGDAAVVRVHGTQKALAITTDCTPRYCFVDPFEGGKQAVAESWRNLIAVGARPLAITNCLNFASPQNPVIMGQLIGCIEGMAEACRALDYPVVSGNVSLYNESRATGGGNAILPTPAIGGVGLIDDCTKQMTMGFKAAGDNIILIGVTRGHLGQSLWLRECKGLEDGPPPPVNLEEERNAGELVRQLLAEGAITAVHDVSDGGIAVALAEMALAGNIGAWVSFAGIDAPVTGEAFGEDQARYIVTVTGSPFPVLKRLSDVFGHRALHWLGGVGGDTLSFRIMGSGGTGLEQIRIDRLTLADLRAAHEGALPQRLAGEL
jgi:phosphoribosylformylglycinamidine synthase subunit PurL